MARNVRWTEKDMANAVAKKNKAKGKNRNQSANKATREVINYLQLQGFDAWRNNTTGIFDVKIFAAKLKKSAGKIAKLFLSGNIDGAIKVITSLASGSYRTHHGIKGVSDILGIHRKTGRFIGVEIKVGKDTLSPAQKNFARMIQRSGGLFTVAACAGDVVEYLEEQGLA